MNPILGLLLLFLIYMMLTVKQLLAYTQSFKQKLVTNSSSVGVRFIKPTTHGKDFRGYYKAVKARAKTNAPGKNWKSLEFRFYYPSSKSKKDQYIPENLRKGTPYMGPEKEPQFTHDSKVFVFCTCEWFLFAAEVADESTDNTKLNYMKRNFMSGDQRITHNNGKGYAPDGPNPRGIPHLCKHLISALRKGALVVK